VSWVIRFVRRYDGEELMGEFTIKKNKWKKNINLESNIG
jgi:hypothetical protein